MRLYFNYQFMGHTRASDLMQPLTEVLKDLDHVNKMVQVSMDRPNVSWALLDNLSIHWKEENAYAPNLINIRSCGLQILHGFFGTASNKTDWNLENFKGSLAHRADYLELNILNEMDDHKCSFYLFPMKYCGHNGLRIFLLQTALSKICQN